jgi:hypothetical protein
MTARPLHHVARVPRHPARDGARATLVDRAQPANSEPSECQWTPGRRQEAGPSGPRPRCRALRLAERHACIAFFNGGYRVKESGALKLAVDVRAWDLRLAE